MKDVAIIGPTAVGKSALAMRLAEKTGAEIISIDSRQVYRQLDIGTAKPTGEERRRIPHHCIDLIGIEDMTNAKWFASMALEAVRDVNSRGLPAILVGGSGMYLRAVTHGLFEVDLDPAERKAFAERVEVIPDGDLFRMLVERDPKSAERIHMNDRYRIVRALEVFELTGVPISEHFRRQKESCSGEMEGLVRIGLDMDRGLLRSTISDRTSRMYDAGWPEEVAGLLGVGADPSCPGLQTLGYPETISYVTGTITKREAIERIALLTGQYAKRQMTWFRKEPGVTWLDAGHEDLLGKALNLLDRADTT